jgi:hypothetical protein
MGRFAKRIGDPAKLEIALIEGLLNGVQAWMIEAAKVASQRAPVQTSRLATEIKSDPAGPREIEPMVVRGFIGVSGLEYARAHEYGSGIHSLNPADRELIEITAGYWTGKSQAKALMFDWPEGPKPHPAYNEELGVYFFHTVYHPGVPAANEGKGYLRLGAEETKEFGRRAILLGLAARFKAERLMA